MKSWYERKTIWPAGWQQAVLAAVGVTSVGRVTDLPCRHNAFEQPRWFSPR